MWRVCGLTIGLAAVAVYFAACSDGRVVGSSPAGFFDAAPESGSGVTVLADGNVVVEGGGVGDPCSDDAPCRAGLACEGGTCVPGRQTSKGEQCVISGECEVGLQCIGGLCADAGAGELGDGCTSDSDCGDGLRCGLVGFSAQCIEQGGSDVGQECGLSGDCFGGLVCAASVCAPAPRDGLSFGLPKSPEIDCAEETTDRVVAHFEVPGAEGTDPDGDFFRLPFPNDIRIRDGRIDLDGFPTPGVSPLVGFDPVAVYVDAIERSESAWGADPTVLFRFSGRVDFDTIRGESLGTVRKVAWIDITDPDAPRNEGLIWGGSPNGGKYVCANWVAMRRPDGKPLDPGHTYAVYMSTAPSDASGRPLRRDAHFEAMLDPAVPADAALAAAHARYAPFRAYLTAQNIDPNQILVASVITIADVLTPMQALAEAVEGVGASSPRGWVKCGGGAESPCPQADADRACGDGSGAYDEYHAVLDLPIFQQGEPPYLESGGAIDVSGPSRTESVCLALTVPRAAMPAAGWPLVVYGHGTGGSFRSHVRAEVAGALASASTPMAVLGYDAVQHGPRRGASSESPENLFFNFRNPDAARGNPLQGAADVLYVGRVAGGIGIPASVTGGAEAVIDPARVVFFGHSQGSMHGSIALPHTNAYRAAVLSGNGASLIHALLSKREPVDIASAVPLVLGDFDGRLELPGGEYHPVLTLLGHWTDPADPLNFARLIASEPVTGITPKHVFQTYGLGDSYSPPRTMRIYALAASLGLAEHHPSATMPHEIGDLTPIAVPVAANADVNGTPLTLALRQYGPPAGQDGHFVVFDVPDANADAVRFLAAAADGSVPPVGQ